MVAIGGSVPETGEFWDFTNPEATWQPSEYFDYRKAASTNVRY